jgi:hypothetical protein
MIMAEKYHAGVPAGEDLSIGCIHLLWGMDRTSAGISGLHRLASQIS